MRTFALSFLALMIFVSTACVQRAGADANDDGKEIDVVIEPERNEQGDLVQVEKSAEQWKAELSDKEYNILREKGTERPYTGRDHDNKKDGVYACAGCGLILFDAQTKFDSGTGWPSFYQPIDKDFVTEQTDRDGSRTEDLCARCGGHLGHVFNDGPKPTGLRHCINGYALQFVEREKFEQLKVEAESESAE